MKRQRTAKERAVVVNRIDAYFQLHPAVPNQTTNGRYVQSLRQALLGKVDIPVYWTPEDVTSGVYSSKHQWATCKVDAGRPRRMLNRMLTERAQIDTFLELLTCGGSKVDASTGLDLSEGPCVICAQVPTEVTYTTCEPPPHAPPCVICEDCTGGLLTNTTVDPKVSVPCPNCSGHVLLQAPAFKKADIEAAEARYAGRSALLSAFTAGEARSCPECGAVRAFTACDDLYGHHGQPTGGVATNNACHRCGFFSASAADWPAWDGVTVPAFEMRTQPRVPYNPAWTDEHQVYIVGDEMHQELSTTMELHEIHRHLRAVLHDVPDADGAFLMASARGRMG